MFLYLSVKRSGLKCSCAINEDFAVLVIRAVDLLSEHAYCVAITFKMTERVEQQICLKFCVKLKCSSMETIWMMPQLWATGDWQLHHDNASNSCITSCAVFWWNIKSPRWLSPTTAQVWHPVTSGFSQNKVTFEREEISDHRWDSGKYDGAADSIGRTVWGPKMPNLKGTEASLS